VFVPSIASPAKLERLAAYGAHVVVAGDEYAHAQEAVLEHVARTGAVLCHAYDQREICAGAGTLGLEVLEQCPAVDTVLLAVGGGGLMAGVATAVGGRANVVGVEPERAPTLHSALAAGEPVDVAVSGVAADSLGARRLGEIGWAVAQREGVASVLVTDEAILEARRWLWDEHRLVVEAGAAAPLAALRTGAYRADADERVVVVLCGANTDPSDL
jgi:threonine dehydratase